VCIALRDQRPQQGLAELDCDRAAGTGCGNGLLSSGSTLRWVVLPAINQVQLLIFPIIPAVMGNASSADRLRRLRVMRADSANEAVGCFRELNVQSYNIIPGAYQ